MCHILGRRRRRLRGGERAAGRWEAVSHLIVARAARRVRWLPSVGSRRASALVSGSAVLPREGPGGGARSGLRACEGRPVGRSGVGGEGDPGGSLLGGGGLAGPRGAAAAAVPGSGRVRRKGRPVGAQWLDAPGQRCCLPARAVLYLRAGRGGVDVLGGARSRPPAPLASTSGSPGSEPRLPSPRPAGL